MKLIYDGAKIDMVMIRRMIFSFFFFLLLLFTIVGRCRWFFVLSFSIPFVGFLRDSVIINIINILNSIYSFVSL